MSAAVNMMLPASQALMISRGSSIGTLGETMQQAGNISNKLRMHADFSHHHPRSLALAAGQILLQKPGLKGQAGSGSPERAAKIYALEMMTRSSHLKRHSK